ncbi:RsmB/NOP family class I SAM-dependent RNA methyltransferase [Hyphomonas sp.]|jgi:16S rRNA (cytosine967-C5)-methyltransferase|uniref:RsmB/NOP family class I SAM-dependent RNA methyltransferase n=1 Tax=Hyphomonas sp. TaxID=87 RepID=UPI00391A5223
MSGAAARRAAGDLLHLTLDRKRTLDEAMAASEPFRALEGPDRGFARAIASSALRHLGWIDRTVQPLISRPLAATSPEIRALIRAGAAQIWFMEVAPHAAVSETVDAARLWPGARSGGSFLNAALRRVSETSSPAASLNPEDIWPDWLRLAMAGGLGDAAARQLARAQLAEPELHLTARTDAAAVVAMTGGTILPSGSVRLAAGAVETLPGYEEGHWWVQDAAAALPARLLDPQADDRVLDLCAAPGGKTLQLAASGARVTAVDRSASRVKRLQENLDRTRLKAEILVADAETWQPPEKFGKILVDAPCSALGTLARHPEGAWIKSIADVGRFPAVQARILSAARAMLAPGGTLVYCVCTPLPSEGREIVEAAIARGDYVRRPIRPGECAGFEHALTPAGDLLTLPGPSHACDAFYIARLAPAGREA